MGKSRTVVENSTTENKSNGLMAKNKYQRNCSWSGDNTNTLAQGNRPTVNNVDKETVPYKGPNHLQRNLGSHAARGPELDVEESIATNLSSTSTKEMKYMPAMM